MPFLPTPQEFEDHKYKGRRPDEKGSQTSKEPTKDDSTHQKVDPNSALWKAVDQWHQNMPAGTQLLFVKFLNAVPSIKQK